MILCFDLDGTLCTGGGREHYADAEPIPDRVALVRALYHQGHTIIIETARGSGTGIDWHSLTERQLKAWGVPYHKLRAGTKIFADAYIDDRAINDKDFFKGG